LTNEAQELRDMIEERAAQWLEQGPSGSSGHVSWDAANVANMMYAIQRYARQHARPHVSRSFGLRMLSFASSRRNKEMDTALNLTNSKTSSHRYSPRVINQERLESFAKRIDCAE